MKNSTLGLQYYFQDIGKNRILTKDEEVRLFKQLAKGNDDARSEIIECNLKFVIQIAHRYRSKGLPLEDLIQEGNLGLLEAVKKFNYKLGFRFSTYAAFWIRQAIQVAVRQRGSLIRLPMRKARQLGFMNEIYQEYWTLKGRAPNEAELASRLEITVDQARDLARMSEAVLSLDAPLEEEGSTLMDIIPDAAAEPVGERSCKAERRQKVEEALDCLSDRENKVIRERFGFRSGNAPSLRKVSARLGLSQEGVRRIEQRALAKLRRNHVRDAMVGLI